MIVMTILGCKAVFDVVASAAVPRQDFPDTSAKITLQFKNQTTDAPGGVFGAIRENLFGEGIHCRGGLSRPDGSHDGNSRAEASFRNHQPMRCLRGDLLAGMMYLAEHERKFRPLRSIGIE